jgi:hypothetical protein
MAIPAAARVGAWALGGAAAAAYATRRIANPNGTRAELAPPVPARAPEVVAKPVPDDTVTEGTVASDLADLLPALEALPKLQKHLKAVAASTADLPSIRKRLDQMRKSDAQALAYAESLPKIERRMREVSQATALMPELLHAVERMTKSIDRLAERLPPPEPAKKKHG